MRLLRKILETTKSSRLHFTLIDPDDTPPEEAQSIAKIAQEAGSDAILVGGSTGVHEPRLSETVRAIKKGTNLPVILFPGNINGLTPEADAVLFMSMLNSDDPYYISGAQVQAAPIVLRMGIEPLPTAYIIVGYGGAAGYIGRARPIPYDRPKIVAAHVLAAAMLGMKLIYLEAGSGAPRPVPQNAIRLSRNLLDRSGLEARIIVGGGIRTPEAASTVAKAGAHILVTGNLVEQDPHRLPSVIHAFKNP